MSPAAQRNRARFGYHAMRLAWCRAALLSFLRRWAIYLLVGAALAGVASSGGLVAVQGLAAWSVLPLFRAAADFAAGLGAGGLIAALPAYAAVAALLVRALRALLWPARWAGAERALPLDPGETLRSDVAVVAGALAPLLLVYAIGAQALLARDPPWLRGARAIALLGLCVVVAGSLGLGVAALRCLRRTQPTGSDVRLRPPAAPGTVGGGAAILARHWGGALVVLPLWRGPARRTGRALGAALACLAAPVLASAWRPAATSWWLAAFAVLAPVATARLRVLASDDFAALRRASLCLPLPHAAFARRLALLSSLPVLVAAPALGAVALPAAGPRWPVLVAFVAGCILVGALEARRTDAAEPAAGASRFLVIVAVLVAIASEATP